MTESQLYEQLGRKQAEVDRLALAYAQLLLLLSQVLSGEVAPERVTVDLARQTWERSALATAATHESDNTCPKDPSYANA
jgi:hypothetical protein